MSWFCLSFMCAVTLLIGYIVRVCFFHNIKFLITFCMFIHLYTLQGHDTVSSALGFCTHLLGVHTDVQKKCQQELDQIMGVYAL